MSELAVSVTKPGNVTAAAKGFLVSYTSNDRTGSLVVPYEVTLCQTGDHAGACSGSTN